MKLKDFMVNSLPRIRGKKKKPPPDSGSEVTINEDKPEVAKCHNRLSKSCNFVPEENISDAFAEPNWRGNVLYQGRAVMGPGVEVAGDRVMAHSYASHGMVSSKSADGFHNLTTMSHSYDARLAVSEYGGSNKIISSSCDPSYLPVGGHYLGHPQQQIHCYLHKHNHQHHHHYHHHHHHTQQPQPMKPLPQNHQTQNHQTHSSHRFQTQKSEPGFFRKSLASFRSIRKPALKGPKEKGPRHVEPPRCAVCPHPDSTTATDVNNTDKRPAKPKRKTFKFSKPKENALSVPDSCDKMCCSDNEGNTSAIPPPSCDNSWPYYFSLGRAKSRDSKTRDSKSRESRSRECSMESCTSRLQPYECSSFRENEYQTFDSASLSGCESDLPRGKVHRSRSRIKTNPWLPSPQPSLSIERRSESCDIQEAGTNDFGDFGLHVQGMVRSASFESPKRTNLLQLTDRQQTDFRRPRSLTPNCDTDNTNPKLVCQSRESTLNREISPDSNFDRPRSPLNDLNSEPSRSRPTSLVSPNSEFVMLADNLEQLAQNISFEYEEMLDSTLENISGHNEDGQESIQELFTDEENKNTYSSNESNIQNPMADSQGYATFLNYSKESIANACSPDSGIGGLGSTDGDDVISGFQMANKADSMENDIGNPPNAKPVANHEIMKFENRPNEPLEYEERYACDVISNISTMPDFESTAEINQSVANCETVRVKQLKKRQSSRLSKRLEAPETTGVGNRHGGNPVLDDLGKGQEKNLNYQGMLVPRQDYCSNLFRNPIQTNQHSQSLVVNTLQRPTEFRTNNSAKVSGAERFGFPRNIDFSDFVESPTDNVRTDRQFGEHCACDHFQNELLGFQDLSSGRTNIYSCDSVSSSNVREDQLIRRFNNMDSLQSAIPCRTKDLPAEVDLSDVADASCQTEFDDDLHLLEKDQSMESLDQQRVNSSENTRLWLLTGNMQDSADTGYSSLAIRDSRSFTDEEVTTPREDEEVMTSREDETMSEDLRPLWASSMSVSSSGGLSSTERRHRHSSDQIGFADTNTKTAVDNYTSDGFSDFKLDSNRDTSLPPPLKPRRNICQKSIAPDRVNRMFSNIENQFEELFQNMFTDTVMTSSTNSNVSDGSDSTLNGDTANRSVLDASFGSGSLTDSVQYSVNILRPENSYSDHIYANVSCSNGSQSDALSAKTSPPVGKEPESAQPQQSCHNSDSSLAVSTDMSVSSDMQYDSDNCSLGQDNADYLAFLRDEPLDDSDNRPSLFHVPGIGPVDLASSTDRLALLSDPSEDGRSKEPLLSLDDPEAVSLIQKVKALRREKDAVYQKIRKSKGGQQASGQRPGLQQQQQQRQLHQQRQQELLESLQGLKKHLEEQSRKLHNHVVQNV